MENPWPRDVYEFVPADDDRTFLIRCAGASPLLMEKLPESDLRGDLITYKPGCAPAPKTLLEQCQEKLYRDTDGYPILTQEHVTACIHAAGKGIRIGPAQVFSQRKHTAFVFGIEPSTIRLQFPPGMDPLSKLPRANCMGVEMVDPASPWRVDVRRGVGESGPANAIVRPCFEKWGFTFTLHAHSIWIDWIGGVEQLQQLVTRAGRRIGLLAFRPACKGPYGRFMVESIEEIGKA